MKIQTRLAILFSFLFGTILFVFIVGVYQFYSKKSKADYFDRLHLQAALKVDLLDGETIAPDILHILYENTPSNVEPQVTIYDEHGNLIYRDTQNFSLSPNHSKWIATIQKEGSCRVWEGDKQIYGFAIEGLKANYIVIASGYDIHGSVQLRTLRLTLGVAYLIAMLFIVLTVRLFTKQAFRPVSKMTNEVKDITLSNHLSTRLDEGNKKDELAKLAMTFNQMLTQLETAFDAQKQFVYNISHELRTPLSAIIAELELSKNQTENHQKSHEEVIDLVLKDAQRVVKLSNSLLDMAKANYSPAEIAMREIRLDELLLGVCYKVQKSEPDYTVHLIFDKEEIDDDRLISLTGNEYLLGVAFGNLIENGCKFSTDKTCETHISYEEKEIIIRIIDHGIGIPPEDIQTIFTPFYRGQNKHFAEGNGIGLSLTHKIIEMHRGTIFVESNPGLTVFTVRLKNLL